MIATTPSHQKQPLFSNHLHLERRLRPDHPLRRLQADFIACARKEARSPAARYRRKRRQQVMEGSFTDAPATRRLRFFGHALATIRCLLFFLLTVAGAPGLRAVEPIHALLITGGCCHDYEAQKKILTEGISARANVTWDIVFEGGDVNSGGTRNHRMSIYEKPDWSKGYDVVVHNECFGDVTNIDFVNHIVKAHFDGVPAVMIHCSTHSYRHAKTDEWRKLLGVSSYNHENARPFQVININPDHPVMKGFPATWQDPEADELYRIVKLWPDCVPLAKGIGVTNTPNVCVWVNTYGKARVFGTTLGHGDKTMGSDVYLDLVTRGLLWACGKLDDNGQPMPGYGKENAAAK